MNEILKKKKKKNVKLLKWIIFVRVQWFELWTNQLPIKKNLLYLYRCGSCKELGMFVHVRMCRKDIYGKMCIEEIDALCMCEYFCCCCCFFFFYLMYKKKELFNRGQCVFFNQKISRFSSAVKFVLIMPHQFINLERERERSCLKHVNNNNSHLPDLHDHIF